MKQRDKENTIKVFPSVYSSPYYELEAWVELENVEDEEDKKCILEDFANNEDFINADNIRDGLGVFLTKESALMRMEELLDCEDERYFFVIKKRMVLKGWCNELPRPLHPFCSSAKIIVTDFVCVAEVARCLA